MGSFANIMVGGYPVHSTKNYYHEFYFRKSDREIRKRMRSERNPFIWSINNDIPDVEETDYIYVCSSATMRRRLDLAGFNRQTLEREFKQSIDDRIKRLEEMIDWDLEWSETYKTKLELLRKHDNLDEWLVALKFLIDSNVPSWAWEDLKNEESLDPVVSLLVHAVGDDDDFPSLHDTVFPCVTVESMVVACMEIMPPDVTCELDITDLVDGGWTESFGDLIEFHQEHTTFYEVFSSSLGDTKSLISLAQDNKTLARLLYANVVTTMETYLSDTFKKQVINREAIRMRFVQTNDAFKEKISLQDIFQKMETLNEEIVRVVDQMNFHNITKTTALYKTVLDTEFPKERLAELVNAVEIRHDIVHRNGKTVQGKALSVAVTDVEHLLDLVDATVRHIDKQVKDGLLEDYKEDPLP